MLNIDNLNIILFILPIYQMLFYTIQLIPLGKKYRTSNHSAGILMLLMLLYLIINTIGHLGYIDIFKYLRVLQLPILLTITPTFISYFQTLIKDSGNIFSISTKVLYLPSIFIFILNIIAFKDIKNDSIIFQLSDINLNLINNGVNYSTITLLLGNVLFIVFQTIIASIQYLRNNKNITKIRKTKPVHLPYLQATWSHITIVSVICFVLIASLMNLLTPSYNHVYSTIFNLLLLSFGGLAGYYSLKQNRLYMEVASIKPIIIKNNNSTPISNTIKNTIDNSSINIDSEDTKYIVSTLENYLLNDKPYLNKDLSIDNLVKEVGTTKQKLAYVVNNVMNTNFYGLINKYRIIEATELLNTDEYFNYKIEAISQMVGFQSKSSFNACFKKIIGETPSEFRKNNVN